MARTAEPKKDTSPRAAGPAGPQFEAKVATHYALAVLAQTQAFGLPGAIVDRLEFQRSGQGHPLDDIIVKAMRRTGEQRCLEVQAKRSMSFTEGNEIFAAVVAAIVEGRKKDASRRFAVALERTSGPIAPIKQTIMMSCSASSFARQQQGATHGTIAEELPHNIVQAFTGVDAFVRRKFQRLEGHGDNSRRRVAARPSITEGRAYASFLPCQR